MYSPQNNLQVDRNQIAQHLQLLGYAKCEKIFLRAFYPSDDPRKTGDKGRKAEVEATNIELIAQTAEKFLLSGMGVYIVVNGGGQKDAEVKDCRAIFYEHDNLSKKLQFDLWRSLGLPEPTFQVDTGGKSIHSYWVFDKPLDPTRWRILQTDLLEFADADRSLKNPSRVMRLAGSFHVSRMNPTLIVSSTGTTYGYEELRTIVPVQQKAPSSPPLLLFNENVPLAACLSRSDRSLLTSGVREGERNTNGAKLARNLIGTALRLEYLGIKYDSNPRQLFDHYCSRCIPPLDDASETENIWKSAQQDNPTATLSDDALLNCVKAWWNQSTQTSKKISVKDVVVNVDNKPLSTEVVDNEKIHSLDIQTIVTSVNAILGGNTLLSKQSNSLDQLYVDLNVRGRLERKLFDRIVAQCRLSLNSLEPLERDRLQELLSASNVNIDWAAVLPPALARDLTHDAAVQNIDPVVLWQALVSTVASLVGVRVNLDVESHIIPALLWTATVLETGGGKTRGDKLILSPLRELQASEMDRYSEAQQQYKREYRIWEKSDRSSDEPTPPALRKYLFEIATIQSVARRSAENGRNGALWGRDELSGLFNSLGQFSGGAADESLQILLSAWNGAGFCCDRVNIADSFFSKTSALSITGGIQPAVFRKIFQDVEDSNGLQARFLFAVPRKQPQRRVKGYCCLSDRLPLLYDWLINVPETTVKLTPEADELYTEIINLAELESEKTANPAVKAWLAKWATQTMRIALILHVIESFYQETRVDTPLSYETLQRALKIAQYYRNAFEFLQEKVSVSDDLSTVMLQIIDRARQTPAGITLRDTYRALRRSIEPLAKEANVDLPTFTEQLFLRVQAEGYGRFVRIGRTVRLITVDNQKGMPTLNDVDNADNTLNQPFNRGNDCQQSSSTTPIVNVDNDTDYLEDFIAQSSSLHSYQVVHPESESSALHYGEVVQLVEPLTLHQPEVVQLVEGETLHQPELVQPVEGETLHQPELVQPVEGETLHQPELVQPVEGETPKICRSICQMENDGVEIQSLVSSNVEVVVLSLSGRMRYSGQLADYDLMHGACTIKIAEGRYRLAFAQETFVTEFFQRD
jgi:hypothetical protein